MRQTGKLLCWIGAILLGAFGCHNHPDLKPPEAPEELVAPPEGDNRYSNLPKYPAESLASDPAKAIMSQQTVPMVAPRGPKPMNGLATPGSGGF